MTTKTLTDNDVIQDGRWDNGALWLYSFPVCGPASIAGAVRDVLAGKVVAFAVCDRKESSPPSVRRVLNFGLGAADADTGNKAVRFCGGDDGTDPDGTNSHSLIASWYGATATDSVTVAAALAAVLARESNWCFRLPNVR